MVGLSALPLARAEETATPPTPQAAAMTPEAKEAAIFFTKLVNDSDNPLISSWAKESLTRLNNPGQSQPHKREVSVSLMTQANSNSMVVPVMLNQKTMGTFLVDTGATYTVITPRMAKKLGVVITPDSPRISIITANGVVKAPMVTIDRVAIGDMQVKNVKAVVQDLGEDMLLAGLLGMNFFQGMDMAVRQNKLILSINE